MGVDHNALIKYFFKNELEINHLNSCLYAENLRLYIKALFFMHYNYGDNMRENTDYLRSTLNEVEQHVCNVVVSECLGFHYSGKMVSCATKAVFKTLKQLETYSTVYRTRL